MNVIQKIQKFQKERRQIRTAQLYYETLRAGGMLIRFIYEDLKRAETQELNRHQRRRFEHEISKEGKFSAEMIEYYSKKIDTILKVVKLQSQRTFMDEMKLYFRPRVKRVLPPASVAPKNEKVAGYNPPPETSVKPKPTPPPPAKCDTGCGCKVTGGYQPVADPNQTGKIVPPKGGTGESK